MEKLRASGMGGAKMFTKDDIEKMGSEGMSREVRKIHYMHTINSNICLTEFFFDIPILFFQFGGDRSKRSKKNSNNSNNKKEKKVQEETIEL